MFGPNRGVLGDPGTAKTLFLVYIGYQSFLNGTGVVANFKLEFPHILMRFDEIGKNATKAADGCKVQPQEKCEHGFSPVLENKIILMTELGRGADSYNFLSKQNQEIADLVFQIRKLNSILYWDAQRFLTVTTKIRNLTNYFFMMNPVPCDPEYALNHPELIGDELEKPLANIWTSEGDKVIIKGLSDFYVANENQEIVKQGRFDGRKYFHLYKTGEMIW